MIQFENNHLSYVYSGLFFTENLWIHPLRKEITYEIILVMDGTVYIEENGVEYVLNKGDLLILEPNIIHKGYRNSNGKTSFYWVHFTTTDFSKFDIKSHVFRHYTNSALFKNLLHIANTPNYPQYGADTALLMIISELSYLSKEAETTESKIIREAAEWIRINSYQKLTAKEIAARYGYNSEHFSRMFRMFFHTGLKEYICRERIKYACDLLCNSPYSIKQIANLLCFEDANQFAHFFKYHQKQPPSQFRNKFYNIHMNQ